MKKSMPSWSGIRAKLEQQHLAPALRGKIQYFATTYSKCPDHEGRAAVRMDGVEILKSSYYESCLSEWNARQEIGKDNANFTLNERCKIAKQKALDGGDFDQRDFYNAFDEFDNQSIEVSLASPNPIVRMFALLDKRVGKRKLIALSSTMGSDLAWLYMFYRLRCEAEGIALDRA